MYFKSRSSPLAHTDLKFPKDLSNQEYIDLFDLLIDVIVKRIRKGDAYFNFYRLGDTDNMETMDGVLGNLLPFPSEELERKMLERIQFGESFQQVY